MSSPNLLVSGSSRALSAKLRVGVDYFNPPTSAWRPALEPWDLDIGSRPASEPGPGRGALRSVGCP